MNRYLVFAYYIYYPVGGWNDFVGAYATLEDAKRAAIAASGDYRHIIDAQTFESVWSD